MASETTTTRDGAATRARILDVALELFNDQGYDKTSLRQIAERLGVTKAALYYHFERKEDILLELHLRLHDLGRDLLDQIDALSDDEVVAAWPSLVDQFMNTVLEHRDLFLMHQRNEAAFHQLVDNDRHRAENEDMEQRFKRFLANPAIPLEARVRMACSVGAVFSALMGVSGMFGEGVTTDEVAGYVRQAVHALFPRG